MKASKLTVAEILRERAALVCTLGEVGPDAPTLAGSWSTTDLAKHVAVQDRFRGLPALLARGFVLLSNVRLTAAYLDRPRVAALVNAGHLDWDESIRRLQNAPPRLVTHTPVAAVTLWEHFVHHEDVRRASGMARRAGPELIGVIEWLLRFNRRRLRGAAICLSSSEGKSWSTGADAMLTLHGTAAELVLWLSGRGEVADVDYTGDSDLFAALSQRMAV